MDSDPGSIMMQLVLLVLLTAINAFFAAAEISVVSINKNRVRTLAETGNRRAKKLEGLIDEPTEFLSTIQVAITLAGFFSSAAAATGISQVLGAFFEKLGLPAGQTVALVVVTLLLSFFTLVFGELVPKRVAQRNAEKFAMFCVMPIGFIQTVASPVVKLLSGSTGLILRLLGQNGRDADDAVSEAEIISLVEASQESGVINENEKDMIGNAIEFEDKIAEEIMTPRTDVYAIDVTQPLNEYLDELLQEKYSRVPAYEDDTDNIVGVLYMKDFMLAARIEGFENVDVRSLLHPAHFVPERKTIGALFREMQASRTHMAILIDEYGGFSGIVTIEDLVEEVMGDIDDEYDEDDAPIKAAEGGYVVNGSVTIQDLNNALGLTLDEDSDDYSTVGGLIIKLLDHIPEDDEAPEPIDCEGCTFTVLSVHDKRIERVLVTMPPERIDEEKAG